MFSVDVEFRHEAVTFAEEAVAGEGEPFGVELKPEAKRPPGNRKTLPGIPQERPECLRLLLVEPGRGLAATQASRSGPYPGWAVGSSR